jgi:hypothetical protein
MTFVASTGVLNSFDVGGGNREDLLDIITNISPMDTLFLSEFEKVAASNIIHEWLVDILADFGDPDVGDADVQAVAEGSDASFDPLTPRKRLCNLTHIIRRTFDVSDTQRDINTAGVRDEYVYQMRKASMELARFIEFALVHSSRQQQIVQGNAAGVTPRKMDGFRAFALSADPTCVTTLGLTAPERATVTTVNGLSPRQKRALSNIVLNPNSQVRYNINIDERTFINSIDYYSSDFGTQKVYLHRYQPTTSLALAERNKVRVAVLRPVLAVELAKLGSSTKGMIEWEGTLEVLAPNAIGLIEGLCTGVPGCGGEDLTETS